MPSTRLTKTNIDRDTLAGMQTVAALAGISTAELIDKIWLLYLDSLNDATQEAIKTAATRQV